MGLPVLSRMSDSIAQAWAEEMNRRDVLVHRPALAPYSGEIIASGVTDPQRVLQMWFDSPPHRQIALGPSYNTVGVGYSGGYWVMVFS